MESGRTTGVLVVGLLAATFAAPAIAASAGDGDGRIYQPGAEFFFYAGKWSPDLDIAKLTPVYKRVILSQRAVVKPAAGARSGTGRRSRSGCSVIAACGGINWHYLVSPGGDYGRGSRGKTCTGPCDRDRILGKARLGRGAESVWDIEGVAKRNPGLGKVSS